MKMNCKYFYLLLGKKIKMNNQVFIPSHGIGELYLEVTCTDICTIQVCLIFKKKSPFFKLILDMASLRMRYYLRLNGNCLFVPQTLIDIECISTYLLKVLLPLKV